MSATKSEDRSNHEWRWSGEVWSVNYGSFSYITCINVEG